MVHVVGMAWGVTRLTECIGGIKEKKQAPYEMAISAFQIYAYLLSSAPTALTFFTSATSEI